MRSWCVIAVAACASGDKAPAVSPHNAQAPKRVVARACPQIGTMSRTWMHEVFAGCPAPPFDHFDFDLCPGGTCPHPCSAELAGERIAFRYDKQGRWTGTTRADGSSDACATGADGYTSCADGYEKYRREAGHLVEVIGGDKSWLVVSYDKRGDPVELTINQGTPFRFTFDAEHRIIEQVDEAGDLAFVYDTDGRIASRSKDGYSTRYEYDERSRLLRVTTDNGEKTAVTTLSYDARDRVTRVVEDPVIYGGPVTTAYTYCD